jgi:hypothetical protein
MHNTKPLNNSNPDNIMKTRISISSPRPTFRVLATMLCAFAALGIATPKAGAAIDKSLQGSYRIKSVSVTVNDSTNNLTLTTAAKQARFPVTSAGLGKANHTGIFKKLGLDWKFKVKKTTSTTFQATLSGQVKLDGLNIHIDSGTITATLDSTNGGTLTYDAEIQGSVKSGMTTTPYTVSCTIVMVKVKGK